MARDPSFEVHTPDGEPSDRLLVALAAPGVAGLTVVDYLVERVEPTRIGHVATRGLPDLTPFSDGRPRHPVRIHAAGDPAVTILESEVFLPVGVADPFADALEAWVGEAGIEEVTVLHGATFPHSEEQHVVFHVGTDAYRERHFGDEDGVQPLAGGFFDGVVAELLTRSLDGRVPPTGVLVTPAHVPGPDLTAALQLLEGLEAVFDVDVDETELRQRSAELRQYYGELARRMESLREGEGNPDYPDDRMYM